MFVVKHPLRNVCLPCYFRDIERKVALISHYPLYMVIKAALNQSRPPGVKEKVDGSKMCRLGRN